MVGSGGGGGGGSTGGAGLAGFGATRGTGAGVELDGVPAPVAAGGSVAPAGSEDGDEVPDDGSDADDGSDGPVVPVGGPGGGSVGGGRALLGAPGCDDGSDGSLGSGPDEGVWSEPGAAPSGVLSPESADELKVMSRRAGFAELRSAAAAVEGDPPARPASAMIAANGAVRAAISQPEVIVFGTRAATGLRRGRSQARRAVVRGRIPGVEPGGRLWRRGRARVPLVLSTCSRTLRAVRSRARSPSRMREAPGPPLKSEGHPPRLALPERT